MLNHDLCLLSHLFSTTLSLCRIMSLSLSLIVSFAHCLSLFVSSLSLSLKNQFAGPIFCYQSIFCFNINNHTLQVTCLEDFCSIIKACFGCLLLIFLVLRSTVNAMSPATRPAAKYIKIPFINQFRPSGNKIRK